MTVYEMILDFFKGNNGNGYELVNVAETGMSIELTNGILQEINNTLDSYIISMGSSYSKVNCGLLYKCRQLAGDSLVEYIVPPSSDINEYRGYIH